MKRGSSSLLILKVFASGMLNTPKITANNKTEVKHAFEINVGDKIYKLSASSLEELVSNSSVDVTAIF